MTQAMALSRRLRDLVARPAAGSGPARNLLVVVRADPIICGHSTEARNLAEAARSAGFEKVHLLTYPIEQLKTSGLPLKPMDSVRPYSEGIHVDRPTPIGDYKVLDGRLLYAISGHLVDLLHQCRGRTLVMGLYLVPHGEIVMNAVQSFWHSGRPLDVVTIAEAVGSDITNVVSNALRDGKFGSAQFVLTNFLMHDKPVAVSGFTKDLIVESGKQVDEVLGTNFAERLALRCGVSYPAIDTAEYVGLAEERDAVDAVLHKRGLERDGYLLYLSRLVAAKGVDDLIEAYKASSLHGKKPLVICGTGPAKASLHELAGGDPSIRFFDDVGDDEKGPLMHGCMAYVFPSKPRPEFVETFGIAVVEKMLAGGKGPVITTETGGIPEATGGHALIHPAGDVAALRERLDELSAMSVEQRRALAGRAQSYALRFDRAEILRKLAEPAEGDLPEPGA
ncbi:MAG: glycosyltransferase family 4 protein [Planctomycetota bacterium]